MSMHSFMRTIFVHIVCSYRTHTFTRVIIHVDRMTLCGMYVFTLFMCMCVPYVHTFYASDALQACIHKPVRWSLRVRTPLRLAPIRYVRYRLTCNVSPFDRLRITITVLYCSMHALTCTALPPGMYVSCVLRLLAYVLPLRTYASSGIRPSRYVRSDTYVRLLHVAVLPFTWANPGMPQTVRTPQVRVLPDYHCIALALRTPRQNWPIH
jgi:hypothetical protein